MLSWHSESKEHVQISKKLKDQHLPELTLVQQEKENNPLKTHSHRKGKQPSGVSYFDTHTSILLLVINVTTLTLMLLHLLKERNAYA